MEKNPDDLQELMDWLAKQGLKPNPKLTVHHFGAEKGYGFLASADLRQGEELFSLPESITDLKSGKLTGGIDKLITDPELDKHNSLVIRLMHEFLLGNASKWSIYFKSLRNLKMTTPYFWSQKGLLWYSEWKRWCTQHFISIDATKDIDIREFFEKTISVLIKKHLATEVAERYTSELFRRMNYYAMSRAFSLNDGDAAFIFPFADLINAKTKDFDACLGEENGRVFMYTVKPVAAGSEIYTTYGELPNTRLLLRYGFAEENNDYDYVQVDPESVLEVLTNAEDETADNNEALTAYLDEHGPEGFILQRGIDPSADFYTTLKLILLPPEDAATFFERAPSFEDADTVLNELLSDFPPEETAKELDKLALLVLASRLSAYPTTLEDDEAELSKAREFHLRCGLLVRIGEKRILADAIARIKRKYQKKQPAPKKARKEEKLKKPAAANRPKMIG